MSGQGRVGKEVVLPDWSAEDVQGERWICLPSSLVVSQEDTSENDPERWTENEVRIRVLRASPTFSAHKDLIQMPCVAGPTTSSFQLIGTCLAEFQTPLSHGSIGEHHSTLDHDLLNITITEARNENTATESN